MLTGQARWKEIMAQPISRNEASLMEDRILEKVLSTAVAIEALETILIRRKILVDDEVMTEVKALLKQKQEQAEASASVSQTIEAT